MAIYCCIGQDATNGLIAMWNALPYIELVVAACMVAGIMYWWYVKSRGIV